MKSPWQQFPSYRPFSNLWKKDEGQEYMAAWDDFFDGLSDDDRKSYIHNHRPPFYWFFFYWQRNLPDSWTFPFLFLIVITWPLRALHHLLVKK